MRSRTRFLLAPLFLVLVGAGFRVAGLHGLAVIALAWGIWHGWMQTYGFARIYDAKRGAIARSTARIDFALCASWFVGAVLLSPLRSFQLLDHLAQSGAGAVRGRAHGGSRALALLVMSACIVLYVVHAFRLTRAGRPQSVVKHALLASSLALWWVATNAMPTLLFGLALFEICHDIQSSRSSGRSTVGRATTRPRSGAITRFVFRGGGVGVGLYVGLVLGYGALGPLAERVGEARVRDALAGVLVASQLLHFYFDGFIWKLREVPTRASLGIGSTVPGAATDGSRRGRAHLAMWTWFVLPLAWLTFGAKRAGDCRSSMRRRASQRHSDEMPRRRRATVWRSSPPSTCLVRSRRCVARTRSSQAT